MCSNAQMDKKDVLEHFGGAEAQGTIRRIAKALDVSTQWVNQWPDLIPEVQAARLEKLTDGVLVYLPEDYVKDK